MYPVREPPLDLTAQVTVHDFMNGSASTSSPSSRLEHGRAMAAASSICVGWVTPPPIPAGRELNVCHDKLFEYMLKAPQFTTGDKRSDLESLQEWNEPFSELVDDYFRLQDLGEFESTDFQILLNLLSHAKPESPSHVEKRLSDADLPVGYSTKRPRLVTASIADLIPQPHFIAGPAGNFDFVDSNKITPFRKAQPSPVPPYDTNSITQLLNSGFRRGAWLVPVRGSPPWDGATTALILDSGRNISGASSSSPSEHTGSLSSCRITWTRKSLLSFWKFLVSIQQAKKLGPMSLSFHAASMDCCPLHE
ncbi:hypothetical protein F5I97DRAFT_1930647 [Phlebopus sp. FC_14]|nr:hypothetical protein F5I97DRAFT_1930647 [Phlebopus sp. FC_14]